MTKQKSKPLGPVHRDSIRRVSQVPDAAKGFPNTNPGYSGPPLIHKPTSSVPKEKAK